MRRRLGIGALFATLALFLAGCMKMDANFTLTEDDTVNGSMIMAISDEFAEMSGQDPQELWDSLGGELTGSMPASVTQEPYAQDGYTGVKLTYADQPLSAVGSATGMTGEELSITREGDEFVVAGTMDMTDPSGDLDSAPPEILDSFQISIAFTFPGEVGETTGTVDGNTVTWTPKIGEVTEISARGSAIANGAAAPGTSEEPTDEATEGSTDGSDETTDGTTNSAADEDSGSSLVLPLIIGIVVLALALLGLVLWLALRKKGTPAEVAAGQASGPYAFGSPGQPYPGQPGGQQYPGAPGQYPQQYPGAPGQYPGQAAQHPQQYPTQPYPPQPGQQYPPQQGQQYPTQQLPPQPGPYGAPPAGQAPAGYGGYGQTPPSPYAPPQPLPPAPAQPAHPQTDPTQPLDVGPQAGGYAPQGQSQGQPQGGYDESEIDDMTRLRDVRPPDPQTPPPPPPAP